MKADIQLQPLLEDQINKVAKFSSLVNDHPQHAHNMHTYCRGVSQKCLRLLARPLTHGCQAVPEIVWLMILISISNNVSLFLPWGNQNDTKKLIK